MFDFSKYKGLSQFGVAYRVMFENDTHAHGSVDRVLLENMVRLCSETVDYLYKEHTPTRILFERGTRPGLERVVEGVTTGLCSEEDRVKAIARFTSRLQENLSDDLDAMRVGGTEEEVIARGSDWCMDVARVGCVLNQVAGFPTRMVYLIDIGKAYSGHAIIEVHRTNVWGAIDPLTDIVYTHLKGWPASTWDLMNDSELIERHYRGRETLYTTVDQFRAAAISNYPFWRWEDYDYTVSGVNNYYRSILKMSSRGWPGGIRWLHGEEEG